MPQQKGLSAPATASHGHPTLPEEAVLLDLAEKLEQNLNDELSRVPHLRAIINEFSCLTISKDPSEQNFISLDRAQGALMEIYASSTLYLLLLKSSATQIGALGLQASHHLSITYHNAMQALPPKLLRLLESQAIQLVHLFLNQHEKNNINSYSKRR